MGVEPSGSTGILVGSLAVSLALHLLIFVGVPRVGWGGEQLATSRDAGFILDNLIAPAVPTEPPPEPPMPEPPPETGPDEADPLVDDGYGPVGIAPPDVEGAAGAADRPERPREPATGPAPEWDDAEIDRARQILSELESAAGGEILDLQDLPPSGPRRRYVDVLRDMLQKQFFYPAEARRQKMHGRVKIQVKVTRAGEIVELRYLERSDFPILDVAARVAVERAAPFPSLEGVIDLDFILINIPFRF